MNAEQIAAGLTKAQREALLRWSDPTFPSEGREPAIRLGLTRWATKLGHRFPSRKLSRKGYAVRAILKEQDHER